MTTLLSNLLAWLTPRSTLRRYQVTRRHKVCALRRALLREALCELKHDAAFASLTAMDPDKIVDRR